LLLRADKAASTAVLFLDRTTRFLLNGRTIAQLAKDDPEHVERTRKNQLSLGATYLRLEIPKIRAKLAFQELVTLLAPYELFPLLVSISPKYLGCAYGQRWLSNTRYQAAYGKASDRDRARLALKDLAKAIKSPPRLLRKRRYAYWSLNHRYEDLSAWIVGFRRQYRAKKHDAEFFRMFIKQRKIPKNLQAFILDSSKSPQSLALEIMASQGQLDDPRALKDFQTHISKLKKKHPAADIQLVVEDFLDLPGKDPELLARLDYLSLTERVRLYPRNTTHS
jgi:hypothetical protein